MADNTKIWPIFRWANWWLSDDLFTGIKNSFYYSNDMEIREDAKSIFPKKVPAYADDNTSASIPLKEWGHDNTNIINVTYSVEWDWDYAGWLVCTDYNIYIYNSQWVTLLCTMSEKIRDLEIFNWYVYVATASYLYYKKDNWYNWGDMASSTDASAVNYWRCTDGFTANWHHPLYWTSSVLCIWDWNKLKKVTKETYNLIQDWFAAQEDYYIMFIDEMGSFVRATANNSPYWSEVLLWDKVSSTPTEVIPLLWYHIIQSCIYNWYHYLLSDKWLWLLNWYQFYILKKAETELQSTIRNGMVVFNDKLYFIANDWIYIYWAKNKNYADVLWLWHRVENGFGLWAIWANEDSIMVTRCSAYIWGEDYNAKVWVDEWLATTGEVQTMCYFGTSMSEIKQSMYLRVGYHIPKEWANTWNIHIYYRTEADATTDNPEDWSWHEATKPWWLYADWDMRSPFATTLKLNCRFQWIQFKFVLTNCVYTEWLVTLTKDTNLYSADLYYNTMLD